MPHDRDGIEIKVGDYVMVPCVVDQITTGEEYCNVTLQTVEPMYPSNNKNSIVLNAKQVKKV